MDCPYCHRAEGHYLGCRTLDSKPGMYQSWGEVVKVALTGLGVVALILWLVRLFGGGFQ